MKFGAQYHFDFLMRSASYLYEDMHRDLSPRSMEISRTSAREPASGWRCSSPSGTAGRNVAAGWAHAGAGPVEIRADSTTST